MPSIKTCTQCKISFTPTPGSKGLYCSPDCWNRAKSSIYKVKAQHTKDEQIRIYLTNPKTCAHCNSILEYDNRKNKFCSSSCAAKNNNQGKVKSSYTRYKQAQRSALLKNIQLNKTEEDYKTKECRHCNKPINKSRAIYCDQSCAVDHKRSKRKIRSCTICKQDFQSSTSKNLCPSHEHMFILSKRAPYEFKFNMGEYPKLFDPNLIQTLGMKSRLNPNGLVRDHKVSIHDAIKNGYDPYYISHVMNCQLIKSNDNLIKGKKSCIIYEHLKQLVDEWDKVATTQE